MIPIPDEFLTMVDVELFVLWCEKEGNLETLEPIKDTVAEFEEIPVPRTSRDSHFHTEAKRSEILNTRAKEVGEHLNDQEATDVSRFSHFIEEVLLFAQLHRSFTYQEWREEGSLADSSRDPKKRQIAALEGHSDSTYGQWIRELNERLESALKKAFN